MDNKTHLGIFDHQFNAAIKKREASMDCVKRYWVKMNGVIFQTDADHIAGWIDYLLEMGKVPMIEKVEEICDCRRQND